MVVRPKRDVRIPGLLLPFRGIRLQRSHKQLRKYQRRFREDETRLWSDNGPCLRTRVPGLERMGEPASGGRDEQYGSHSSGLVGF